MTGDVCFVTHGSADVRLATMGDIACFIPEKAKKAQQCGAFFASEQASSY